MARRALNADGDLLESAFQAQVVGLLRSYGWELIFHAPAGGRGSKAQGTHRFTGEAIKEGKGFPDIVAVHEPTRRLLFAELKTDKGRADAAQVRWLEALIAIGRAVDELAEENEESRLRDCVGQNEHRPVVETYLWRPRDWHELHRVIRGGAEHRRDLDPLEFG